MKFLDPDHPFFAKSWVRWATVLFPTAWGLVELFVVGAPMWGVIFLGLAAYAAWMLLLRR